MKVLYIERCLNEDSLVFDQIQRISSHVETCTLAVQVGNFPHFQYPRVVSVRCPFFPKIEMIKGWLFARTAMISAQKLFKQSGFDLIHSHFVYPDGLAARKIGRRFNLPYIVSGRGSDVLHYPNQNRYLRDSIAGVLSGTNAMIGVSQDICDTAIRLGACPNRCFKFPDGIKEDIFYYAEDADSRNHARDAFKQILFAGSFLPVKNVMKMAEAFSMVAERIRGVRFKLAGKGPLESKLKSRLDALKISDKCEFAGQLSHAQLADAMRKAHVLCLPSTSEGWPNVVCESMACGTPVVGANVGGIPEQISSDEFGLLCDPRSPEDIAEKLMVALNKKWDHEKIARHGRLYTRDETAKKIVEVYKTTLGAGFAGSN